MIAWHKPYKTWTIFGGFILTLERPQSHHGGNHLLEFVAWFSPSNPCCKPRLEVENHTKRFRLCSHTSDQIFKLTSGKTNSWYPWIRHKTKSRKTQGLQLHKFQDQQFRDSPLWFVYRGRRRNTLVHSRSKHQAHRKLALPLQNRSLSRYGKLLKNSILLT